MSSESRRNDIDGLRAIAVLSVTLFHFNEKWLPGGFIGVDIFFVISSFLITNIIFSEIDNGVFSIGNFYIRRMKRILPASLLVFTITALIASQLSAIQLTTALYIPIFVYNFHLDSYFSPEAHQNFFLHYWSLSIEEQFYLFWPLALVLAHMAINRIRLPFSKEKLIIAVCLTLSVVWIGLGEYWIHSDVSPQSVYFYSIPRFGELTLGACFAFMSRLFTLSASRAFLASASGVALVIFSLTQQREFPYPGINSLAPCIGAGLLLLAGVKRAPAENAIYQFLGSRPLAFIGRISFSLYLWHWPVLAITRFLTGQELLSPAMMICDALVIGGLSFVSYHFVEKPAVESKLRSAFAFSFYLSGTAMALFIAVAFAGIPSLGVIPLVGRQFANVTVDGQNAHLTEGWLAPCWDLKLDDLSTGSVDVRCHIGAGAGPRVLLVGDSHAAAIGAFVDVLAKAEGFQVTSFNVGACQIAEWGIARRAPPFVVTEERIRNCKSLLNYVAENADSYDAILIANAFNLFAGEFNLIAKKVDDPPVFNEEIVRKISEETPVIFIHDSPVIDRSMQYSPLLVKLGLKPGGYIVPYGSSGNLMVRDFVRSLNGVQWLDLEAEYRVITDKRFLYKDYPLYVDTNHLNGFGARHLADMFVTRGGCLLCATGVASHTEKHALASERHR